MFLTIFFAMCYNQNEVSIMIENSKDVFSDYNLPFKTYFSKGIDHDLASHEEIELIWMLKGMGTINYDGEIFHLTDQSVFFICMDIKHAILTSTDSIVISYRFKKDHLLRNNLCFKSVPFEKKVFSFHDLSTKYHQIPLLVTQLSKLLKMPSTAITTRYKIIGYFNLFLYDLYNMRIKEKYLDVKNINYDPYLIRIHTLMTYISNHISEKISLHTLSKITNISTYRLSHFFKEVLGISFCEYLQYARLERAIYLLKETNEPIKEVSKQSGFSDIKYLNKMLKETFNMTALKYRKVMLTNLKTEAFCPSVSEFVTALQACLENIEGEDTYGLSKNQ